MKEAVEEESEKSNENDDVQVGDKSRGGGKEGEETVKRLTFSDSEFQSFDKAKVHS